MEEDKEFMKDIVKMLLWQHKIFQCHSNLQYISNDLEKVFHDPRLSGHAVKTELLSIQCKLDDILHEIRP